MPTPKRLASVLLREALAAAAAVKMGRQSVAKLGELSAERRHCDIHEDLWSFFNSLKPYRRFDDFQGMATLPRPRPLRLHIEPHIFHGHFRAWLRKRGIDSDTIQVGDSEAAQEEPPH